MLGWEGVGREGRKGGGLRDWTLTFPPGETWKEFDVSVSPGAG